ncbi:MAG: leucyl aminopeptidase [Thermodesulfovibrionales bacterium]|nr:leucyl aminopeptidase [Thermodesulfovibrionales bacterium]
MKVSVKNIRETNCICDALVLPFIERDSGFYKEFGTAFQKQIMKAFSKEFHGKRNELLLMPAPEVIKPGRILLIGLGKKNELSDERIRQAGGKAAVHLRDKGMKKIAVSTNLISSLKLSPLNFIEGALLSLYKFERYRKEKDNKKIESITILLKTSKKLTEELKWTETITSSVYFARDLINTPANDMTPSDLAKTAVSLRQKNLSVKILEKKDAEKLGMGAYLSVAKGSKEPPKFIVLKYKGRKGKPAEAGKPLALIGKSITFDSGGISLKPSDGMEKMKYDMAGGAAVLGVLKAASALKLPVNLIGILPATENLPGGSATKPGDVAVTISGKTVEIINTDAEGRLILADAIGYAKRFKPRAIIDIATLTAACSVALGNEAIAMMGNDRKLLDKIKKSADNTYERVWEMPLFDEYKEYLKSDIADIKNTGGKNGSLVTAAYFLYEFAEKTPWVHLDIAGTAWVEKDKPYIPKGASGIGVRLIMDLIKHLK